MLIPKFMPPQSGKQNIAMLILPKISGSKDNQTMKFVQFIEYKMRNIFLGKSYTKFAEETIPRPSSKNKQN